MAGSGRHRPNVFVAVPDSLGNFPTLSGMKIDVIRFAVHSSNVRVELRLPAKLLDDSRSMPTLTGLLILLCSCVGHAEWWVLFVNRIHALPIDHRRLRISRKTHDTAFVLFPLLLLWLVGIGRNGLLTGGQFGDQSRFVQMVIVATSLGCVPLTAGVIRWQLFQRRRFLEADHRAVTDLARIAKQDPTIGDVRGPRKHVSTGFPFNEFLKIEVNHKTICLGRSALFKGSPVTGPVDAVGTSQMTEGSGGRPLRIVHLSDLHFVGCPGEGYYRWVIERAIELRPDAFMFTGDLIDNPSLMQTAARILRPLAVAAPSFFVLGNHDWRFDHAELRRQLVETGWICVAGITQTYRLAGRTVSISGTERPWMGQDPPLPGGETDESEAVCELRLLLSHSPDQIGFARRSGFDVMLAGHTHGGQVVLPIIGPVFSPSRYGVRFASGLFQEGSLAVHVSRGIGGKDPLRWRCLPELTCLTIEIPPNKAAIIRST